MIIFILGLLAVVSAGSNTDDKDSYKNQFRTGHAGKHNAKRDNTNFSSEYCTDPRTMKKHPAYTEWADAYSCTRHRCQPGGRNLAIYTVGCKRVEAPESAIECEEVVEDTNMQFPFCCTRLRCLVVVRGEVWTRVLGQPWEVLPAAPWSHMYKMKKPPPADSTFLPKTVDQGPIYELTDNESDQNNHDKVLLRTGKKAADNNQYNEVSPPTEIRAEPLPSPDIVIALTTDEGKETTHSERKKLESSRHSKRRKANALPPAKYFEAEGEKEHLGETLNLDLEDREVPVTTEKTQEPVEEETEKYFNVNSYPVTQKSSHKSNSHEKTHTPISWTEIPLSQWNEPKEQREDQEPKINEHTNDYQPQEPQLPENREPKHEALQIPPKKEPTDKPSNLQALVDAIGTRMRDIENVVQKMSYKVHQVKSTTEGSSEKRVPAERDGSHKRYKEPKRPSTEDENYKRFTVERSSKYLHSSTESTTEKPLFIEDSNLTGYFSDASNSILRRNGPHKAPKEPPPTYMAPVAETRRKSVHIAVPETLDDEKKHKKHTHKKRRNKSSRSHKKHSRPKEDRRKHFNKLSSGESEKNAVSLDDISDLGQ